MALPLIGVVAGLAGLYLTYSLVSLVSHALAIVGGVGVFGLVLRYLVEKRPVELWGEKRVDNLIYAGFSIPLGFLAYRVFEALIIATSILIVLLLVVVVASGVVLGPARLLGFTTALVQAVKE